MFNYLEKLVLLPYSDKSDHLEVDLYITMGSIYYPITWVLLKGELDWKMEWKMEWKTIEKWNGKWNRKWKSCIKSLLI